MHYLFFIVIQNILYGWTFKSSYRNVLLSKKWSIISWKPKFFRHFQCQPNLVQWVKSEVLLNISTGVEFVIENSVNVERSGYFAVKNALPPPFSAKKLPQSRNKNCIKLQTALPSKGADRQKECRKIDIWRIFSKNSNLYQYCNSPLHPSINQ